MTKFLTPFSRFFVGILFIVSGLVKLNDPIGTAIKMEEYFEVFATDFHPIFQSLTSISLLIAVIMIVAEVVLGVALILKYNMTITTWLLLVLIVFFSFLTFYSAYFNKVTDCGCFGDAIKLTPWTSFGKDMVLLVFIVILFVHRKTFTPCYQPFTENIVMALTLLFTFYVAYFTVNHLSFIDLRAYKPGADIGKLMKPSAPIQYKYILTKDGQEHEFTTYPSDTTYKFKSMEIVNKEALPKITDYAIWNDEGDFTQESLTGKKLLIFVLNTEKANSKKLDSIARLADDLEKEDIKTWLVTASDYNSVNTFRNKHRLSIPYFYADATIIKTIIRSNPGLVLLQNGVVRGKWHYKDTPTEEEVKLSLK
jgi:uncharacterized membrane protein YphA (DoxX/SURF4 family)